MTIAEIYDSFPSQNDCIHLLEKVRWPVRVTCPYCKSRGATPMPSEQRHHCNHCRVTFSVTVNTVFHRSHLPIQKWFLALLLFAKDTTSISVRQLATTLQINKNTAEKLSIRIRRALTDADQRQFLLNIIERCESQKEKYNHEQEKNGP